MWPTGQLVKRDSRKGRNSPSCSSGTVCSIPQRRLLKDTASHLDFANRIDRLYYREWGDTEIPIQQRPDELQVANETLRLNRRIQQYQTGRTSRLSELRRSATQRPRRRITNAR